MKACSKYSKLKLNCWIVVSKNKAPFYPWQASRSAARAVQVQSSGVQAGRVLWLTEQIQTSSASCGPWLTFMCMFLFLADPIYLLHSVWFPWQMWKLSPCFYCCPSKQHLMSCGHLPAAALAQLCPVQVSHCTLILQLNTWVASDIQGIMESRTVSVWKKKLLVSVFFLIFDGRAWNREFGCLLGAQWGFSFVPEYPC